VGKDIINADTSFSDLMNVDTIISNKLESEETAWSNAVFSVEVFLSDTIVLAAATLASDLILVSDKVNSIETFLKSDDQTIITRLDSVELFLSNQIASDKIVFSDTIASLETYLSDNTTAVSNSLASEALYIKGRVDSVENLASDAIAKCNSDEIVLSDNTVAVSNALHSEALYIKGRVTSTSLYLSDQIASDKVVFSDTIGSVETYLSDSIDSVEKFLSDNIVGVLSDITYLTTGHPHQGVTTIDSPTFANLYVLSGGIKVGLGAEAGGHYAITANSNAGYLFGNYYYDPITYQNKRYFSGAAGRIVFDFNTANAGDILFGTAPVGDVGSVISYTTRLRIKLDGKIGIGTDSPNEHLEVTGKIRANTGFNLNGTDGVSNSTTGIITGLTVSGGIVTAKSTLDGFNIDANNFYVPVETIIDGDSAQALFDATSAVIGLYTDTDLITLAAASVTLGAASTDLITHTGRMIVRTTASDPQHATPASRPAGTVAEIVYYGAKMYFCTNASTPTWEKITSG
jgi:hypothetical protein